MAFATHLSGKNWRILARGDSLSHTGDTSLTTLATVTVPANTLGANGTLRVTVLWDYTNSGNAKTLIISYGGTTYYQVAPTTNQIRRSQVQIVNIATNSQVGGPSGIDGFTTASTSPVTSSVDTTASTTLLIRCQLANSGETITLDYYVVEVSGS